MHKLITAVEGMRQLLQRPHVGIRKPDLSPSRPILWPAPQTIVLQHAKGKHSSKLVARLHNFRVNFCSNALSQRASCRHLWQQS